METLTTGQVAEQAEINTHTVRYYVKRGLRPKPPRSMPETLRSACTTC